MRDKQAVLEGTVERITFRNEENGYTVLRLMPSGRRADEADAVGRDSFTPHAARQGALKPRTSGPDATEPRAVGQDSFELRAVGQNSFGPHASVPVTVVGRFPTVSVGEQLRLWGRWVQHPQYGRQFEMADFAVVAPSTLEGIRRYLGSGLIRGIGPALAERLVRKFGVDTLHVITETPERLQEVEGIGPRRAEAIAEGVRRQQAIQQVMVFLQGHGISTAYAARIYRIYGDDAVAKVRANPYRLATEIPGIGFKTADKIARSVGVDKDAPVRLAAGLEFVLQDAASRGHVCVPRDELLKHAAEILEAAEAELDGVLDNLLAEKRLVAEAPLSVGGADADPGPGLSPSPHAGAGSADPGPSPGPPPGPGGELIYLPWLHRAEAGLAAGLRRLHEQFLPLRVVGGDVLTKRLIEQKERETGLRLSDEQRRAVMAALEHGVFVLTGGPGTGKTTILRMVLACLEEMGQKVELACPTGRAAQRLREATGKPARTIHRLLEFGKGDGEGFHFQRDEKRPLEADAVIIDEASMIDVPLAHHLVRAIAPGTRLILVGDVDQLPPVGPGCPLRDIIDSGVVPVARLTRIFRQAQQSLIVSNAHRILQGGELALNRSDGDFFLIEKEDPEEVAETVRELAVRRVPGFIKGDPVEDVQVLSPMRRTVTGVDYLNEVLQASLNPPSEGKPELRMGGWRLRVGDKVMQTRNNYDKAVFNGDVGRVEDIDEETGEVWVRFPQPEGPELVRYEAAEADELTLAYCITVHKSQGSEYPAVILPLTTQHYMMLQRNLLYTAVTRAKRLVVIVGSRRALRMALDGVSDEPRLSRLAQRLQGIGVGEMAR